MHGPSSDFPVTHDGYLKYFILNYDIDEFDAVIVDEVQDSNMAKIQMLQKYSARNDRNIVHLVGVLLSKSIAGQGRRMPSNRIVLENIKLSSSRSPIDSALKLPYWPTPFYLLRKTRMFNW